MIISFVNVKFINIK